MTGHVKSEGGGKQPKQQTDVDTNEDEKLTKSLLQQPQAFNVNSQDDDSCTSTATAAMTQFPA